MLDNGSLVALEASSEGSIPSIPTTFHLWHLGSTLVFSPYKKTKIKPKQNLIETIKGKERKVNKRN